jgi:MerR family transcriptional regulator, light-induced transcriptional regulator
VQAVRLASVNPHVLVMVGGPLFALHPHWADDVGADLCPAGGHEAPLLAARLVLTAAQRA